MSYYNLPQKNKYYALYSALRDDILRGKYAAGERLPSKRALSADLGVSVVTIELAYGQLEAEGYIKSRERSGYFVEEGVKKDIPSPRAVQSDEETPKEKFILDFAAGHSPSSYFPFSVWAKLMRFVLSDSGEHLLGRVPCDGAPRLKKAIADYLYRSRGIEADPRRIVIGAGAEYLYGLVVQLLGRDKIFAVENPGYPKISSTYLLNGAKIFPLNVKEGGICPDELEKSGAAAVHLSPAHQFPTGEVTPVSGRLKIINSAGPRKYIIEDDYDSEFRLFGKPLQSLYSLSPDRVIYINTFSKTLAEDGIYDFAARAVRAVFEDFFGQRKRRAAFRADNPRRNDGRRIFRAAPRAHAHKIQGSAARPARNFCENFGLRGRRQRQRTALYRAL